MTKDDLLWRIETDYRQLVRYLFFFEKDDQGDFVPSNRVKLKPHQFHQPGVEGDQSIQDLLILISGRERFFVEWYEYNKSGKDFTDFPPGLSPINLAQIDQFLLAGKQEQSLEDLLHGFRASHQRLIALIRQIPGQDLSTANIYPWTEGLSLTEHLRGVTWESYRQVKKSIRKWSRQGTVRMNKDQLLASIQTERRRLEKNLASLSGDDMLASGVIGTWSVKDILAHLVDWEQRFLGWYRAGLRGEIPQTPAPGLTWSDLDQLNQQIYEQNNNRSLESVMTDFHTSFSEVFQVVKGIPEEDIFTPGRYAWTERSNLAAFIKANTANHYRWAKTQIRRWMRSESE